MLRALTLGVMVLTTMVAASNQAQAGFFDFLAEAAEVFDGQPAAFQSNPPPETNRGPTLVLPESDPASTAPLPIADSVIELYPCVTYEDLHEMHPCAEPVIVSVPDPSSVKHPFYWLVGDAPRNECSSGCCTCCSKPLVYVEICAPPGCCLPEPTVHCNGRKYVYDFGEYRVDVRLQRGGIEVDYQD